MQHELIFVIGPPRSGSTMLQRMLGSHSAIFTHPEPHIITPLAHLGYYASVDRAPYDHINAAEALRSRAQHLLPGEGVLSLDITPVLGAHLGPGAVGFACVTAPGE